MLRLRVDGVEYIMYNTMIYIYTDTTCDFYSKRSRETIDISDKFTFLVVGCTYIFYGKQYK